MGRINKNQILTLLFLGCTLILGGCENPLMESIEVEVKEFSGAIPKITSFTLSGNPLTNEVIIGLTLDGTNIAAWLITESSTAPTANDPSWVTGAPGSFTLSEGDGAKELYLWAKDADGYITGSGPLMVTLDTTLPEITNFSFTDISENYTTDATVNITLTGSADIALWAVTTTASAPAAGSVNWQTEKPATYGEFTTEGDKRLYVWAMDGAGNINGTATSLSIYYYENLSIENITTTDAFVNETTIPLTITDEGISSWLVLEEDDDPTDNQDDWVSTRPTSFTLAGTEGERTLYVWGRNAGGVVTSPAKTLHVTYDVTAPEISIFELTTIGTPYTTSNTVDITLDGDADIEYWSVTETSSLPAPGSTWVSTKPMDYGTFTGEGSKTLYAWATDRAGNTSMGTITLEIYYYETLSIDSFTTNEAYVNETEISISITDTNITSWLVLEEDDDPSDNEAGWTGTRPTTFTLSGTEGERTLYVRGRNAGGVVTSPAKTLTVTYDITAPEISTFELTTIGTPYTTSNTVDITLDGDADIVLWAITETSSLPAPGSTWVSTKPMDYGTFTGEGSKTLYAWATDFAGNTSVGATTLNIYYYETLRIDSFTTTKAYVNETEISISITDTNVTSWLVLEEDDDPSDNEAGWTGTRPTTFTLSGTEGERTLYIWGKNAGEAVTGPENFQVTYDITPPSLTAFSRTSATPTTNASITLSVSGTGASAWLINENSTLPNLDDITASEAPTSYTLNDSITRGDRSLYIWAKDEAGNVTGYDPGEDNTYDPVTLHYYTDATQPTVSLEYDSDITGHEDIVLRFSELMNTGTFSTTSNLYTLASEFTIAFSENTGQHLVTLSLSGTNLWKISGSSLSVNLTATSQQGDVPLKANNFSITVFHGLYVSIDNSNATNTVISGEERQNGTSRKPFKNIQPGVNHAWDLYGENGYNSVVRIAEGDYSSNYYTTGTPVLDVINTVDIYGGYKSDDWAERDSVAYRVNLIDTSIIGGTSLSPNRAVNTGDNINVGTTLDGLWIKPGTGIWNTAIYTAGTGCLITLQNLRVYGETTSDNAGENIAGIYNFESSPTIIGCSINPGWNNGDPMKGVSYGIYNRFADMEVSGNCYINAGNGGAVTYGIYMDGSSNPEIYNSFIDVGESADSKVGLAIGTNTNPYVENNIFTNNQGLGTVYFVYEMGSTSNPISFRENHFGWSGGIRYRDNGDFSGNSDVTNSNWETKTVTLAGATKILGFWDNTHE